MPPCLESDEADAEAETDVEAAAAEASGEPAENGGRRRRRRRRRGRNGGGTHAQPDRHEETADAGGEPLSGEPIADENGELSEDDLAEEPGEAGVVARNEPQRDGDGVAADVAAAAAGAIARNELMKVFRRRTGTAAATSPTTRLRHLRS